MYLLYHKCANSIYIGQNVLELIKKNPKEIQTQSTIHEKNYNYFSSCLSLTEGILIPTIPLITYKEKSFRVTVTKITKKTKAAKRTAFLHNTG